VRYTQPSTGFLKTKNKNEDHKTNATATFFRVLIIIVDNKIGENNDLKLNVNQYLGRIAAVATQKPVRYVNRKRRMRWKIWR
jgi:ribosomal protein L5